MCAFFSKILSNEYVTVERKNGFRVPLGKSLINTSVSHMKFEWAPEEEEFLEDELYFLQLAEKSKAEERRREEKRHEERQ